MTIPPERIEAAAARLTTASQGWNADDAERASAISLYRCADVLNLLEAYKERGEELERLRAKLAQTKTLLSNALMRQRDIARAALQSKGGE